MTTELHITAISDVGRIRSNNEDMVMVGERQIRNGSWETTFHLTDDSHYLVALADGMGGHNAGEVASEVTLNSLRETFCMFPKGMSVSALNERVYAWVRHINHKLETMGHEDGRRHGMGTTLVGVLYYEGHVFWLNSGDSRLYLFRNGQLQQLTTDHSLSNLTGRMEQRNVIVNCIGGGCNTSYIEMNEFTHKLQPGDTLMLCSDGLSDLLSDVDMERLLVANASVSDLCSAALAAGGNDNVSVCLIKTIP